jgi:EAL domain-containing protein (putative c-di-GMP-specific phosphodiesterase class I)
LKIDRSFIQSISGSAGGRAIPEAIIGLAKGLKLAVVAEGVETPEQLAFIRSRGCDEAQGFHFSKPVAAEDITRILGGSPYPLTEVAACR